MCQILIKGWKHVSSVNKLRQRLSLKRSKVVIIIVGIKIQRITLAGTFKVALAWWDQKIAGLLDGIR